MLTLIISFLLNVTVSLTTRTPTTESWYSLPGSHTPDPSLPGTWSFCGGCKRQVWPVSDLVCNAASLLFWQLSESMLRVLTPRRLQLAMFTDSLHRVGLSATSRYYPFSTNHLLGLSVCSVSVFESVTSLSVCVFVCLLSLFLSPPLPFSVSVCLPVCLSVPLLSVSALLSLCLCLSVSYPQ